MYGLFFPIAVTAVITILLVVAWLVAHERSSCRRQRRSAAAFFEAQDGRFTPRQTPSEEQVVREAVLTASRD